MEKNKYKRFMDFLLEQIALFPDFDFSVGDSPEQSSRSFYRNLQTYTAFYALAGAFDDKEMYLRFRKELQSDVLMWQQICKSYAEIVKSNSKDKFSKLETIVKAYREKTELPPEAPSAQTPPREELSPELKEELGLPDDDAPASEDDEAERALQQQQQAEEKKKSKAKA